MKPTLVILFILFSSTALGANDSPNGWAYTFQALNPSNVFHWVQNAVPSAPNIMNYFPFNRPSRNDAGCDTTVVTESTGNGPSVAVSHTKVHSADSHRASTKNEHQAGKKGKSHSRSRRREKRIWRNQRRDK